MVNDERPISRRTFGIATATGIAGMFVGGAIKGSLIERAKETEEEVKPEPEMLKWMSARVEQVPHRFSKENGEHLAHLNVYLDTGKKLYEEGKTDPRKITLALNCGTYIPEIGVGDTVWFDLYEGFREEIVQVDAYSTDTAWRVFPGQAKGNLRSLLKNPESRKSEVFHGW